MAIDEEFEKLKRKRLTVLNEESPVTGELKLQGPGEAPPSGPIEVEDTRGRVVEALKTVYDPEIPLNIYELGLIYGFDLDATGNVHVRMTLTAPGCPVAGALIQEVHEKVRCVPGIREATTELVWDPPWTRERMSDEARLELGLL
jgi:FeS assembly SUF system protein